MIGPHGAEQHGVPSAGPGDTADSVWVCVEFHRMGFQPTGGKIDVGHLCRIWMVWRLAEIDCRYDHPTLG